MIHGRKRFVNIPKFFPLIGMFNQNLLARQFVDCTYISRPQRKPISEEELIRSYRGRFRLALKTVYAVRRC